MKAVQIKGQEFYRKKGTGNPVWKYYIVDATSAELEALKAIKGDYYRETSEPVMYNGKEIMCPLLFENNWVGDVVTYNITSNNKLVIDQLAMLKAESIMKSVQDDTLKNAIAAKIANESVGDLFTRRNIASIGGAINKTENNSTPSVEENVEETTSVNNVDDL
jgi:hypothetical protein